MGGAFRRLIDLAWYAGLGVVTTLAAMGFLGMYTRPLGVPLVYISDALSGGAQFKGTLENGQTIAQYLSAHQVGVFIEFENANGAVAGYVYRP